MNIGETIAEVLLSGLDKDVAIARVGCSTVASESQFCSCGEILDQQTVAVVTVRSASGRRTVQGFCPACWAKLEQLIIDAAREAEMPVLVETWEGVTFSSGDVMGD